MAAPARCPEAVRVDLAAFRASRLEGVRAELASARLAAERAEACWKLRGELLDRYVQLLVDKKTLLLLWAAQEEDEGLPGASPRCHENAATDMLQIGRDELVELICHGAARIERDELIDLLQSARAEAVKEADQDAATAAAVATEERQEEEATKAEEKEDDEDKGEDEGEQLPAADLQRPEVRELDPQDLDSVLDYLADQAAPAEAARGLDALASLAYDDAAWVGGDTRTLPRLLALHALHFDFGRTRLGVLRVLCNLSHDPDLAGGPLASPGALTALLAAAANQGGRGPREEELRSRAGEALARVVAAGGAQTLIDILAQAIAAGEHSWATPVVKLLAQFVDNEVLPAAVVARAVIDVAVGAVWSATADAAAARRTAGWLLLVDGLAAPCHRSFPAALVAAGAVEGVARAMERHPDYLPVQRIGLQALAALSDLAACGRPGRRALASQLVIPRIEEAIGNHCESTELALAACQVLPRALESASAYGPFDLDGTPEYCPVNLGCDLLKVAMRLHPESPEMQAAALEGLALLADRFGCGKRVSRQGGLKLVRAAVSRHRDQAVQRWGRSLMTVCEAG